MHTDSASSLAALRRTTSLLPSGLVLPGWLLLLLVLAVPSRVEAYPWMIRHDYASCAACHVDPSGGGILTDYGRAQSELLLAMRTQPPGGEGEVSPSTDFLFGAVTLPEWLNLAFAFRGGALLNRTPTFSAVRPVQMLSDVRGAVSVGQLRASASLGFALRRALPASLTPFPENNLVSREHWLGVDLADGAVLLRAGRIVLPFGLRNVEHALWVRETTGTDSNEDQQHGLSVAYNVEGVRAELMGFVGSLQLHPAYYRERGYSGYVELALSPHAALGVSSLMAQARYDLVTRQPFVLRQAHGLFARWAPVRPLVLMVEADALLGQSQGQGTSFGGAGALQADVEVVQGLHLIGTAELLSRPELRGSGGWLSVAWFFNPHAELRVDGILRRTATAGRAADVFSVLGQLHLNL
jgi:hypothetical protein